MMCMFKVEESGGQLRQLSPEVRRIIYRWLNNCSKREANVHRPMTTENTEPGDIWRQVGRMQMLMDLSVELERYDGHDGSSEEIDADMTSDILPTDEDATPHQFGAGTDLLYRRLSRD